jgi:para-nitrobenzyl esterase
MGKAIIMRVPILIRAVGVLLLCNQATAYSNTIALESGPIAGAVSESNADVRVYRGIPYATPPVSELRWRPPAALTAWDDVRPATEFSAICPQGPALAQMTGEALPAMSEDCLYLNVWTTADKTAAKLPVMVWIHGGGLTLGWGHQRGYDGTNFAEHGVVLVSINYRLGALGFLSHPELSEESQRGVSGNYGLLDQLAALDWVQRNIAQFGGDPDNVTIFGESAGGTSVNALVASPLSRGLFHKAIAQSPWVTDTNYAVQKQALPTVPSAEELGIKWAEKVGGEQQTLASLRSVTVDEVMAASQNYPVVVTVDGWFMPDSSENIYANGAQQDVPLIVGTNQDEGTIFLGALPFDTPEAFEAGMRMGFGEHADEVLALYPATDSQQLFVAKNDFITDSWFVRSSRGMLEGMSKVSSDGYQYHFTRRSQAAPMLGAHHGMEIGYAFDNLPPEQVQPIDSGLADAMIQYWVQFARSGNPNVEGLPHWPSYEPSTGEYLELGDDIKVGDHLRKEAIDTLDSIHAAVFSVE